MHPSKPFPMILVLGKPRPASEFESGTYSICIARPGYGFCGDYSRGSGFMMGGGFHGGGGPR
jgi:hypothetical protein